MQGTRGGADVMRMQGTGCKVPCMPHAVMRGVCASGVGVVMSEVGMIMS